MLLNPHVPLYCVFVYVAVAVFFPEPYLIGIPNHLLCHVCFLARGLTGLYRSFSGGSIVFKALIKLLQSLMYSNLKLNILPPPHTMHLCPYRYCSTGTSHYSGQESPFDQSLHLPPYLPWRSLVGFRRTRGLLADSKTLRDTE